LDLAAAIAAVRPPSGCRWIALRGDLAYTHIRAERRINVTAKLRDDAMLLESERGIIQPGGSPAGAGRFRSLSPAGSRVDLSISAADQLTTWLSASFASNLSLARKHALLGPFTNGAAVEEPLDQRNKTVFANTDLTLDAQAGRWQIGLFGNYAYRRGRTATDRPMAGAPNPLVATTRSVSRSIGIRINAFGPVVELPAGPITLNLGAGVTRDAIDGAGDFGGFLSRHLTALSTTTGSAAIEIPIASRSAGVLARLGDLSASVELNRQHTSDFGSFNSYTVSLLWRPVNWLSLTGSMGRSDSAPPVASLDEPLVETPGFRYFDPLRGETVDVTWITGGTPGLRRQSDESRRLAANVTPFPALGLRLSGEYVESRNLGLVSDLPLASLSIMQAFPERFIRDGSGRLIAVDARPVSFASREEQQLRTGFILSLPIGVRRPGRNGSAEVDDGDDALLARPVRSGLKPRLQISASYSWLFKSELAIRTGQPAINLLSPAAVGFGGLGQPRHRIDGSLGFAGHGLGVRAGVQWRGPSLIEASGITANVLRFHPLTSFSLRAWIQGERLAPRSSWMKGTRLSLSLFNATGARERVNDRYGVTPLSYQRGYRDPIGRSFEIQLRKRF
jgi:hypothetical protein